MSPLEKADSEAAEAALARKRGPEYQDKDQVDSEAGALDSRKKNIEPETETDREFNSKETSSPPLPDEEIPQSLPDEAPPLPDEPLPDSLTRVETKDDGWEALWDANAQAFYFHNRFTNVSQWENPRVPEVTTTYTGAPGTEAITSKDKAAAGVDDVASPPRLHGGYNPAIHGDYDPTAPYALEAAAAEEKAARENENGNAIDTGLDSAASYAATGQFNRFTGRWQAADVNPDKFSDEAKSKRQMNAFFDVDAAANSHHGKSLKAERAGMRLSKAELKAFKEKRREKKEEKRRAWLRD